MTRRSAQQNLPFYLSEASFWMPNTIVQSGWLQNAPFAFWLVDALRPSVLVELGTHNGFSYLCFCQTVDTLDTGTQCFAVDTWVGDEHSGFYGEEVLSELRSNHDGAYGRFSRLVQSTFDEAIEHFSDHSIDLLHIDGRHYYDDVKHDFDTWLPKLSQRAVVLLHDINVREGEFGVGRFWEELEEGFPTFAIRDEHGLGVVGVGERQTNALSMLFESHTDPDLENEIRRVYQRLGWAVTATFRSQDLETAHRSSQAESESLRTELAQQIASLKDLHSRLNNAHQQVLESEQRADVLHQQVLESEQQFALLQQAAEDCDRGLLSAAEANADLRRQVDELTAAKRLADETRHERLSQLASMEKESDRLRSDLNAIYSSRAWWFVTQLRRLRPR